MCVRENPILNTFIKFLYISQNIKKIIFIMFCSMINSYSHIAFLSNRLLISLFYIYKRIEI